MMYIILNISHPFKTLSVHLQPHRRVHFKSAALHLIDAAIDIRGGAALKTLGEKLNTRV